MEEHIWAARAVLAEDPRARCRGAAKVVAVMIVAGLFLWSGAAFAEEKRVDCDTAGETIGGALGSLSNPAGPNRITVTGTCTEAVAISYFNRLTIEAPANTKAYLSLPGCDESDASYTPPLKIQHSQDIVLRRLVISGGGGLSLDHSDVVIEDGVVIEKSKAYGVLIDGPSTVTFNGPDSTRGNFIRDNCGLALSAKTSVSVYFNGHNSIQRNGSGISAWHGGAYVQFSAGSTGATLIEGNRGDGVQATGQAALDLFGGVVIRNNRGNGIRLIEDGQASLVATGSQRPLIADNDKAGIWATTQGKVMLYGATITGNAEEGIRLQYMSIGLLQDTISVLNAPPGNTISGNGVADVSCDRSSVVAGKLKDVAKLKCANAQPE